MPSLEVYVPARVSPGVDLAFLRLGQPKVIMQVKIIGLDYKRFDKHRLLIMFLDGKVELDFCDTKSLSDLMGKLDPNSAPGFAFEEQDASGVVWHGVPKEGTGIIGKILNSKILSLKIYFDDYTSDEFTMSQDELFNMKQKISSEILGA